MELAKTYDAEGADELTFLDISASSRGPRDHVMEVVSRCAEEVFIPLTVGGGVSSVDDVDRLLRAGADKVAMNTAAIHRPDLIAEVADRFGNQVLVLSVDARRAAKTDSGFEVTTHGGRKSAGLDAIEWAARAAELGAGEILLNAMDADGTQDGFDLELIRAVRREVTIPVIASGGAGVRRALRPRRRGRRRRGARRHGLPLRHAADRRRQGRPRTGRPRRSAEIGRRLVGNQIGLISGRIAELDRSRSRSPNVCVGNRRARCLPNRCSTVPQTGAPNWIWSSSSARERLALRFLLMRTISRTLAAVAPLTRAPRPDLVWRAPRRSR